MCIRDRGSPSYWTHTTGWYNVSQYFKIVFTSLQIHYCLRQRLYQTTMLSECLNILTGLTIFAGLSSNIHRPFLTSEWLLYGPESSPFVTSELIPDELIASASAFFFLLAATGDLSPYARFNIILPVDSCTVSEKKKSVLKEKTKPFHYKR